MKISHLSIVGFGIIVLLFWGCIEPLNIEIEEPSKLLVIEGMITDREEAYKVNISWSKGETDTSFLPLRGAVVYIEEEGGRQAYLAEGEEGTYISKPEELKGEIGKKYRLQIQLASGEQYASDWELLKRSPPIDSLYFQYEERINTTETEQGISLYLNSEDKEATTWFYRWKWIESWEYTIPLPSPYEYLGNNEVNIIDNKETCYRTINSNSFKVGSSIGNSRDIISDFPLLFVSTKTKRLQFKYSLLVQQIALDQKEFLFWKSLQELDENSGTLFERQPQSSIGNMRNISNKDEAVLGYFSASAISEKRIFFRRPELPQGTLVDKGFYADCFFSKVIIPVGPRADQEVFDAIEKDSMIFIGFAGFGRIDGYILAPAECSDCTVWGGGLERPDFWD